MGMHQNPFLFSKKPTLPWPSATQIAHWAQALGALHMERPPAIAAWPGPDGMLHGCVAALEEMHEALQREAAQRQGLERALHSTRQALAQAQADLACLRGSERQARHQALHDELTALPNRRHLLQQLNQALAQRRSGDLGPTVIYIDLDHFKAVNDAHGHGAGDEVLRITAARLGSAVRQGDMVVRLGGDEFACLLQGITDKELLQRLCAKLRRAVSQPMKIAGLPLRMRASMGVAICPPHGAVAQDLLACADAAMYAAKRDGCGVTFADRVAGAANTALPGI